MSEPVLLKPEMQEKLGDALDRILGNDGSIKDLEPLTKEEFDLRVEYTRLSWRLVSQIGPYNFESQARSLLFAMALARVRGDDEEAFVKRVIETMTAAGLTPKPEPEPIQKSKEDLAV